MTRSRIDTHLHIYRSSGEGQHAKLDFPVSEYGAQDKVAFSARGGNVTEALEALADAGVSYAAVLNVFVVDGMPWPPGGRAWPISPPHAEDRERLTSCNGWVCDLAAGHEPLLPFVSVHPGVMSARESAAHVAELADRRGACGVKLHTIAQRVHPAEPAMWPTYARCEERGLPIVAHCGPDRYGAGFSTHAAFAPVLDRFPRLLLVLAHLGGAAWSETAAFARTYPRARFDVSEIIAWTHSAAGTSDAQLARLIQSIGAERVLMGSDFPWYEPLDVIERIESLPGLSAEERARILGQNAVELLALPST